MTITHSFDKTAIALGIASIASVVFAIDNLGDFRFMTIERSAIAVALGLGGLAVVAGMTAWRALAAITGLGFAAAALLQLVSTTSGTNWIGGDLSAMAFWAGIAVGLILAGTAPRHTPTDERE